MKAKVLTKKMFSFIIHAACEKFDICSPDSIFSHWAEPPVSTSREAAPHRVTQFGVKGLDIAVASAGLQEGTGHHHLIVDGPRSLKSGEAIPFDDVHIHFGKVNTEGSAHNPRRCIDPCNVFTGAVHIWPPVSNESLLVPATARQYCCAASNR